MRIRLVFISNAHKIDVLHNKKEWNIQHEELIEVIHYIYLKII